MSPEIIFIRKLLADTRPPYMGLIIDTREEWVDGKPRAAFLILYRDNFESFSDDQKVGLSLWISDILNKARQVVGPNVFLEVAPYVSGRLRG